VDRVDGFALGKEKKIMTANVYEIPKGVSDIMGVYDTAHWQVVVAELKPDSGVLLRGSVLSAVAADGGKLTLTTAGSEATAFGVLLDASIDTALKFSDNSVTGSVARAGSFRGQALRVGVGTNAATLQTRLREVGIFLEGPVTHQQRLRSKRLRHLHRREA
jgi:hypothetical protein